MEKFTKINAEKYIKTTNDAQVAQLGHINALVDLINNSGSGGGVTEVTYTELQALMSSSSLVPGVTYKITGFNKNMPNGGPENPDGYLPEVLYDDGTNSGITIYVEAITTSTLSSSGYGEFYNPKYASGADYNNSDGTGLYQIWDGDNPDPLLVPAYQVGDVVMWGGYAWENISGMPGNSLDMLTLTPTDWVKLPYSNTTWYELVIDEIQINWFHGIVIERYNPKNEVRVKFETSVEYNNAYYTYGLTLQNPSLISLIPWGLYSQATELPSTNGYGINEVEIVNSWVDLINYKGSFIWNLKVIDSMMYDNYYGRNVYFNIVDISAYSYFTDNSMYVSAFGYVSFNKILLKTSFIERNIMEETNVSVGSCEFLDFSSFNDNLFVLNGSNSINNNYLKSASGIDENIFDTGLSISNNILNAGSFIRNNEMGLGGCLISYNTLDNNSSIEDNYGEFGATIINNILQNQSKIKNFNLQFTNVRYNTFNNGVLDFTLTALITSVEIARNHVTDANVTASMNTATHIYAIGYMKQIFTRQDGTVRLSYFNNSDVLTVVNVNA